VRLPLVLLATADCLSVRPRRLSQNDTRSLGLLGVPRTARAPVLTTNISWWAFLGGRYHTMTLPSKFGPQMDLTDSHRDAVEV